VNGLYGSSLAEILADPRKTRAIPADAVPDLLAELERMKAILWAQLMVSLKNGQTVPDGDRLLGAKETATRMGVSLDYVYKTKTFPFAVKEGRRLLFSQRGLDQYLLEKMNKKGLDV
jgi:hypothetical protein